MSAACPILGFAVTVALTDPATEADARSISADLLELLAGNGLSATGPRATGGGNVLEFFVQRDGSQATDADRVFVRDWSARWTRRAIVTVGDLTDLTQTA